MMDCTEDVSRSSVSLSDLTSSSSVSDKVCVHWGCELSATQTMTVFEAEDDLLENQFFIKTVSFPGLELMPPVTFQLCSGTGPVFISAQHITLNPTEITEEEEDDEEAFRTDVLTV